MGLGVREKQFARAMGRRRFEAALALDDVDNLDLGPDQSRLPPAEMVQLDLEIEPIASWPAYLMAGLVAFVICGLALFCLAGD